MHLSSRSRRKCDRRSRPAASSRGPAKSGPWRPRPLRGTMGASASLGTDRRIWAKLKQVRARFARRSSSGYALTCSRPRMYRLWPLREGKNACR